MPRGSDRIPAPQVAEAIRREHRFAKDGARRLHRYDRGRYCLAGTEAFVRKEVLDFLEARRRRNQWSSYLAREVIEYLIDRSPELPPDPDPNVLNVRNGLLNLRTGKLRPHTPDHLSTIQIPVQYDRRARCPAWFQFLRQALPKGGLRLAFELIAFCLDIGSSIQKAIVLLGGGGNGKSALLAAIIAFLGRENVSSLSLQSLAQNRFATSGLYGKLANVCPDLPSGRVADSSAFKSITGGDPIMAEPKHKQAFSFRPFVKLLFSSNTPPQFHDDSDAIHDRWLVIPMNTRFRGEDEEIPRDELDQQLADPQELSGVLNEVLKAYGRLRKTGRFTEPRACQKAREELREVTDPFRAWLEREVERHPKSTVVIPNLRSAYNTEAEEKGLSPLTSTLFGKRFAEAMPDIRKGKRGPKGKQKPVYIGIGWRQGQRPDADRKARKGLGHNPLKDFVHEDDNHDS